MYAKAKLNPFQILERAPKVRLPLVLIRKDIKLRIDIKIVLKIFIERHVIQQDTSVIIMAVYMGRDIIF